MVLPARSLMDIETEGAAYIEYAQDLERTPYFPRRVRTREQLRIWLPHLDSFVSSLCDGAEIAETADEPLLEEGSVSQRLGITKNQALMAFGNLVPINFAKVLADVPKWIVDARLSKGTPGDRHKTMWCPVLLAVALHERKYVSKKHLNRVFFDHEFLKQWRQEWHDVSEDLN